MNTTEHLELILAYCRRCLVIAEKRTLGEWTWGARYIYCPSDDREIAMTPHTSHDGYPWDNNAKFIATCAGAAEAGWRATIAAVTAILSSIQVTDHLFAILKPMQDDILAAYPIELIQSESAK